MQYDIVSANQAYCFAVLVRALLANQLQGMNLILLTAIPSIYNNNPLGGKYQVI